MYNTDLPSRAELPSTGQLLRSTVVAALIAAGLLITTVLPAEYGIDPTGVGRVLGLTKMGEIKVSLSREANAKKAPPAEGVPAKEVRSQPPAIVEVPAAKERALTQQHTTTVTLKPGQAAEIKLAIRKGVSVEYEWSTVGGAVNYDSHGEPANAPKNFYHGYGKGLNKSSDAGVIQAAFDGTHGWYWRNRSGAEVTVTLKTSGDYETIKRVL